MSSFEYTDPDGEHLSLVPHTRNDGAPVVSLLATQYDDRSVSEAAVHIPLNHVEEVVAGLRDMARQAATRTLPTTEAQTAAPAGATTPAEPGPGPAASTSTAIRTSPASPGRGSSPTACCGPTAPRPSAGAATTPASTTSTGTAAPPRSCGSTSRGRPSRLRTRSTSTRPRSPRPSATSSAAGPAKRG